jgi:hypothetical protein
MRNEMKTVTMLVLMAALPAHATMVYDVETPVLGSGQLGMMDTGFGGGQGFMQQGQAGVTYGTLSEKIYVDFESSTYRLVGGFALNVGDPFTIHEFRTIGGQEVPGDVTVAQAFESGVAFDTGMQPLSFDSINHATGPVGSLETPTINASWMLTTGGQSYSGNFSYDIPAFLNFHFRDLTFSDDRSTISLARTGSRQAFSFGAPVVEFTADNGFTIRLKKGISDFTDQFTWGTGPAVATLAATVPEAGDTLPFLLIGLVGLAYASKKIEA